MSLARLHAAINARRPWNGFIFGALLRDGNWAAQPAYEIWCPPW